jgi:hypothetical protein
MSEVHFAISGSQSSRLEFPKSVATESGIHLKPWVPRQETEWSLELSYALLQFFTNCSYPFRSILSIPFKDPLRSEIRRFFLSLDAYIESPNPVIPYRDILYGAADIKFSEYLKRVKRKSLISTWGATPFAFPDWWKDVPEYQIKDIGDIFNYSYLILFKEDTDDYLEGFTPVKINDRMLTKFKDILFGILPERGSFNGVDKLEIISNISSSISIERGSLQHKPHYKIKNRYLSLSKTRHPVERSVIRVSPNNCRDSVLNDPGDLCTISLIDQQLMEVLRVMPGHIHLRDKEEVTRRYHSLFKKFSFFLHRDLKKEGITKPRALLRAMLEVLHEKYPDIEVFGYISFYDELSLRVNGEVIHPCRGHGLGMANSLTTLMQLAVHELILDELADDFPFIESLPLTINDDFTAGFRSSSDLELYWDKEDEIMDDLSIFRSPDKSFYCYERFVLAERYFTVSGEYEKTSYQQRELLLPLACANITHAKEYFSSVQTYVNSKFVGKYVNEIRDYFGYEFYPMEFFYPTIVGGWINEKVNSVDMSLLLLDQLDLKSYVYRGYNASKRKLWKREKGELFTPPIQRLLGYPSIPKEYLDNFDILPESAINDRYGKILSRSNRNFLSYWDRLFRLRQNIFKEKFDVTYEELIGMIIKDHPTTQFYPCYMMIKSYHTCNIISTKVDDIYLDPNPRLSLVSYYNNINYNFKERFSIEFVSADASTKKTSSLFSKEVQRTLKSEAVSALMTGRFHEIYYPSDGYSPEEQYLNPIKIAEVTAILNWGFGYPELKPSYVSPILEKKREVYGRIFSLKEQALLTSLRLSRDCIQAIANTINRTGEGLIKHLEELRKFLPEVRKEQSEPEDDYDPDCPHLYSDSGPKKVQETEEHIITLDDLLSDNSYKFFNWEHDRKSWIPADSIVECHLARLSEHVTYATFPGMRTTQQRLDIKRDIETGRYGSIYRYIANQVGVLGLLSDQLPQEDTESCPDLDALFGGGDT